MPFNYEIRNYKPRDIDAADVAACVALIRSGYAVDPTSAARELPHAILLAVARIGENIAGVGAIKRARPRYAERISTRSGAAFNPHTPELGYVAVDSNHQSRGLSHRLVAALLSEYTEPLFATTDDERMKKTLVKAGFIKTGEEWRGQRGSLTLWLKD